MMSVNNSSCYNNRSFCQATRRRAACSFQNVVATTESRRNGIRQRTSTEFAVGLLLALVHSHGRHSPLVAAWQFSARRTTVRSFTKRCDYRDSFVEPRRRIPGSRWTDAFRTTGKSNRGFTSNSAPASTTTSLSMALIPLTKEELQVLIAASKPPTGLQYATYWGRTARERYQSVLESAIVSFLGVFFSYFLSFVIGGFVSTILGSLFVFWGILSPELKAYQRNWEFLGGRTLTDPWTASRQREQDPDKVGLYGAMFVGHVQDVCVVEDAAVNTLDEEYDLSEFQDYTMETDELEKFTGQPHLLRLRVADTPSPMPPNLDNGRDNASPPPRKLQIHARLSEDYLDVAAGMPCLCILLSTSQRFDVLAAITDIYVPEAACWIGDYPYLERAEVLNLLATDDDIWDALQAEGYPEEDLVVDNTVEMPGSSRGEETRATGGGNYYYNNQEVRRRSDGGPNDTAFYNGYPNRTPSSPAFFNLNDGSEDTDFFYQDQDSSAGRERRYNNKPDYYDRRDDYPYARDNDEDDYDYDQRDYRQERRRPR